MAKETAGLEDFLLTATVCCEIYCLFLAFVYGAFFRVEYSTEFVGQPDQNDCRECKLSSTIDCRGVVDIVWELCTVR